MLGERGGVGLGSGGKCLTKWVFVKERLCCEQLVKTGGILQNFLKGGFDSSFIDAVYSYPTEQRNPGFIFSLIAFW